MTPRRVQARKRSRKSSPFGSWTQSRSPASRPREASACAILLARASTSPKVKVDVSDPPAHSSAGASRRPMNDRSKNDERFNGARAVFSVRCLELGQSRIGLRPPVAKELPHVAHLADLVEIELRRHQLRLVARSLRDELTARITEVALPIKLPDVPRRLVSHAIDRAHEEGVGDGVRGLLEPPEILGEPRDGGARIEDDLRSVEPELARALGEVPVVADVDADVGILRLEHGIPEIPGPEVELLPEARRAVWDMVLAILAEVRAVGVDDGGGVVVHARRFFLVERHDDHHLVLLREVLHQPRRGPVRDVLRRLVPSRRLLGAEVGAGEDLLHAEYLNS